eukprot:m.93782 g.93782  ORF g.93782 m.93782 type:complete len:255 (+) comp26652_c1_seq2:1726-2490(+)
MIGYRFAVLVATSSLMFATPVRSTFTILNSEELLMIEKYVYVGFDFSQPLSASSIRQRRQDTTDRERRTHDYDPLASIVEFEAQFLQFTPLPVEDGLLGTTVCYDDTCQERNSLGTLAPTSSPASPQRQRRGSPKTPKSPQIYNHMNSPLIIFFTHLGPDIDQYAVVSDMEAACDDFIMSYETTGGVAFTTAAFSGAFNNTNIGVGAFDPAIHLKAKMAKNTKTKGKQKYTANKNMKLKKTKGKSSKSGKSRKS